MRSSVQLLSCVQLFATPWATVRQASLSITSSRSLLKFMSIVLVMLSNHLVLCHPLLLLPSIFPSIRVFSNESVLHIRWPKYWSFSFNISPSNEYSGLISFRIDWFDLLSVQGTLKSLLQHHSSKASILRHSAFFTVQLSHPYVTTRKTVALTRRTFVGKVMSLLFNMLSSLVISFLPRSKCLLISWLWSQMRISLCSFHILRSTHVKSLFFSSHHPKMYQMCLLKEDFCLTKPPSDFNSSRLLTFHGKRNSPGLENDPVQMVGWIGIVLGVMFVYIEHSNPDMLKG